MEDSAHGPIFRANKRRKVFRKRAESDTNEDEPHVAADPVALIDGNASESVGEGDSAPRPDITRVRKPKKHGIAFSSSERNSSRPQDENEETAMVVSEPHAMEQQNGRFTRQTGKAIVADDKHMSAYIDSKLAEMRSAATAPNHNTKENKKSSDLQSQTQTSLTSTEPGDGTTPLSPLQPPSTTSIAKPTALIKPTHRRPNRKHRAPSPSTLARSSLIDQILSESNHTPHYTPPSANPNNKSATTTTANRDEGLDLEAAAAAAFKADFLAQAEARNLSRRHPAVNASAGGGSAASAGAAASSGPKLGGSRAARERMRAAEEAKGKK